MTVIQLSSRTDLASMPKMRLLVQWANDYITGVISGFNVPGPGYAAKEADIPRLREEFIRRLDDYARVLPWNSKWLLMRRAQPVDI